MVPRFIALTTIDGKDIRVNVRSIIMYSPAAAPVEHGTPMGTATVLYIEHAGPLVVKESYEHISSTIRYMRDDEHRV